MAIGSRFRQFFIPTWTYQYLLRVSLVALSSLIFFGFVCIPVTIPGKSMEPNYHDGNHNFCWRLKYSFRSPERHDVVFIRLAPQVMLLKRVVALEGEEVEFRKGRLLVQGNEIREPYVHYGANWDLPPWRVEKGCVYVVGDNRGTPIQEHYFGQTPVRRVAGGPLW